MTKDVEVVIRPLRSADRDAFIELVDKVDFGVASLPKNEKLLVQKVKEVDQLFKPSSSKPEGHYLFVLEERPSGRLIGVSGIYASRGHDYPIYFYKIEKELKASKKLKIGYELLKMRLVVYKHSHSEFCSLFLDPAYRLSGRGKLLSLSRLLFLANFPERFTEIITADMRGVIDAHNNSPFWDGCGSRFIKLSLSDALLLASDDTGFIPELLPEDPIYLDLLPSEAIAQLGEVHPNTAPALKMLLGEGFQKTDEISIFDAGPKLAAPLASLRIVRESKVAPLAGTVDAIDESSPLMLISNCSLNYRCCLGRISQEKGLLLTPSTAALLELKRGDQVRFIPCKKS